MTDPELRFSPRANRASEIDWMRWDAPAFARAVAEDKPILLSISAVWCHWCHVMDETSYSDEGVIATINRRYVAIRVDNDRRPDVNARYNMGGWPTTAFLAPDGTTLTGATYLPPPAMQRALDDVADFYRDRKAEIAQRSASIDVARPVAPREQGALDDGAVAALLDYLRAAYDSQYGGFGTEPKFPQPDALEFALTQWRASDDAALYEMVAHTMRAMSRGGMYDHVEGGFFRYSTTRDWSVPHFEKMAEDHAGLIRVLADLVLFGPDAEFRETLVSTLGYLRKTLRDPRSGFFAGSQDADEHYFALPRDERAAIEAPFVDRTSYTNWTCALAGAQCVAARALEDDALLREALATLDNVDARLRDRDGLLFHVATPDGSAEVPGLFTDQAAYVRAALDAHEHSGETRFLERAVALADRAHELFSDPAGGYRDRLGTDAFGRLAVTDRSIVENGWFADSLLRLEALTGENRFGQRAHDVLQTYAPSAGTMGAFGSSYANALARFLAPGLRVRIVGSPAQTYALREAAVAFRRPFGTVRTIAPDAAPALDLPAAPHPAAYVCTQTACGPPAYDAAELRRIAE